MALHDAALQAIAHELRERLGVLRVTIRLRRPGAAFPVAAQARAPEARSLEGELSGAAQKAPTYAYLATQKRVLVQDDVLAADVAPPAELLDVYGTRAQMLAPVLAGGELIGIVAVHDGPGARAWTQAEVEAAEDAATRVLIAQGALTRTTTKETQ